MTGSLAPGDSKMQFLWEWLDGITAVGLTFQVLTFIV